MVADDGQMAQLEAAVYEIDTPARRLPGNRWGDCITAGDDKTVQHCGRAEIEAADHVIAAPAPVQNCPVGRQVRVALLPLAFAARKTAIHPHPVCQQKAIFGLGARRIAARSHPNFAACLGHSQRCPQGWEAIGPGGSIARALGGVIDVQNGGFRHKGAGAAGRPLPAGIDGRHPPEVGAVEAPRHLQPVGSSCHCAAVDQRPKGPICSNFQPIAGGVIPFPGQKRLPPHIDSTLRRAARPRRRRRACEDAHIDCAGVDPSGSSLPNNCQRVATRRRGRVQGKGEGRCHQRANGWREGICAPLDARAGWALHSRKGDRRRLVSRLHHPHCQRRWRGVDAEIEAGWR